MRMLQSFALIPLLMMMSCSGGGTPPSNSNNTNNTAPYVYLAGGATGNWQISSYLASDTGNATAANTITGSSDPNVSGLELSSDGNGNLYTMTDMPAGTGFTVSEYSLTNGVLTLRRAFTSLAGQIGSFVPDKSGMVYIAQDGYVVSFAASASGTATITQSYQVTVSGAIEALAEDANGNMYVGLSSNTGSQTIEEFPAGFSSLTPIKTININPYFTSILGLAVDGNGTLYAAGDGLASIFGSTTNPQVYAVVAYDNGSLTPTRTLSNSNDNNLIGRVLNSIAVDRNDLLYVYSYLCPSSCSNTVAVFSATATGNVAPLNFFQNSGPLPILQSMVAY